MKKISNASKASKLTLLAIIIVIVAGSAVFAYKGSNKDNQPVDVVDSNASSSEEKQSEANEKEDILKKNEQAEKTDQDSSGQKKQVGVVITSASQSGINAYVSGAYEDGGECKAVITKGSQTITKITEGFKDATTTICKPINLSRSDFPSSGTWKAEVNYTSETSTGKSQSVNIEVL